VHHNRREEPIGRESGFHVHGSSRPNGRRTVIPSEQLIVEPLIECLNLFLGIDRHRSREFVEFLSLANQHYPSGARIRVVLDNHSGAIKSASQLCRLLMHAAPVIFPTSVGS
jgi:hypothetical protein